MTDTAKPTKLPRISETNYEAVRSILKNGVPSTYPEWLNLVAKWRNEYVNVTFIDVDPKELARFFGSGRYGHDLTTLFHFIHENP
jgi:hypothetical protein